jgi:hypothetical protein
MTTCIISWVCRILQTTNHISIYRFMCDSKESVQTLGAVCNTTVLFPCGVFSWKSTACRLSATANYIYRESSFYANSIYAVSLIRDFTPKKYFYTGCSITRWRVQGGWPIIHLRFNLKSHCSITHLHSHKNCRISLKKKVSIYAISVYVTVFRNASNA